MTKVNIHDAKTHLSRYIQQVEGGETVTICRHNEPVAEIRPIQRHPKRREFGADKGKFTVGPAFFEPLPQDILRYFEGED